MKILIASDKFKGTFTSSEIGKTISEALKIYAPTAQTETLEVSDGGEGLIESLRGHNNYSRWKFLSYSANKARKVQSKYLYNIYTKTAVIESASTIGLSLLRKDEKQILKLSSFGLGYDISRLLEVRKPKKVIIGSGGTATCDLFCGGANALGYKFLDALGNETQPIPENFMKIQKIIKPENPVFENSVFETAADVKNPLCGINGAAKVFAPQKGATQEETVFLDSALRHIAEIIDKDLGVNILDVSGAGSGGGIGGGLKAFLNSEIISGADFVLDSLDFNSKLLQADLIITGEGCFDSQSLSGKITGEILSRAASLKKKAVIICGKNNFSGELNGVEIMPLYNTNEENFKNTKEKISQTIEKLLQKKVIFS